MSRRSMGSSGGGGSRSSFSSSSSSSRSSFSSSSSYHSSSSGSSHHYGGGWHGGHHHYYGASVQVSGKTALIMFVIFLMIIVSIFIGVFGTTISGYNSLADIKKADYEYYVSMIKTAQSNPEYSTEATVTKVEYDSEVGGYYFEYKVSYEHEYYDYWEKEYVTETRSLNHSTFACYKYEDIAGLLNTTITVALDCDKDNITNSTDTMPINYINTKLTDDAEYKMIANTRGKFVFIQVVLILAEVGGVVGIVFIAKHKKKETETETASTETSNDKTDNTPSTTITPKYVVCDYCGDTSLEGTKKCPTCGANLKIKNKE